MVRVGLRASRHMNKEVRLGSVLVSGLVVVLVSVLGLELGLVLVPVLASGLGLGPPSGQTRRSVLGWRLGMRR